MKPLNFFSVWRNKDEGMFRKQLVRRLVFIIIF